MKWQRLRGKNKPSKEQKQNSGDNLSWIRGGEKKGGEHDFFKCSE